MSGFWASVPFIILFSSISYCCVYATRFFCEASGNMANKKVLIYKEIWGVVKPCLEMLPLYMRSSRNKTEVRAVGKLDDP